MKTLHRILGLVLAAVFLWAGLSKLTDLPLFMKDISAVLKEIYASQLLGYILTLGVPALEVTLAFFLLLGRLPRETLVLSAALLAAFLCWQVHLALADVTTGCGCFKTPTVTGFEFTPAWRIARGAVLLVLAGWLLLVEIRRSKREPVAAA